MVTRFLAAATALVATAAFSEQQPFDAFLAARAQRPLFDARGLSAVASEALAQAVPSSTEPRFGVPTFLWSSLPVTARPPRALGLTAEQAARRYLAAHAELYRGSPARWADASLTRMHDLGAGAVIATFQQRVEGQRVFRDEVKVVMTHDLQLVAISGYLTPEVKPLSRSRLTDASVIASAYQDLSGQGLETNRLTRKGLDDAGFTRYALSGERTAVRVRHEWYAMPEGLEDAAHLELEVGDQYFAYVVSTADGRVLSRHSLTRSDLYKYRVWADATAEHVPLDGPQGNEPSPHPAATPNGYAPPFIAPSLIELSNGPISTNDPWLPAQANQTRGNNAFAYADIARSNGFGAGDVVPTPTAANEFDRTYDVTQAPNASNDQIMAAVTQLFYNVNFFHDWYYDRGFNEAAGNAQTSNFGRGGAANDAMLAEGQDYSGTDNANMSTPSDGDSPRMQMYIFKGRTTGSVDYLTNRYAIGAADFGPQTFNVPGELAEARDASANPSLGCQTITSNVAGKIALVDRGSCTFAVKATNVEAAGAIGLIIIDNQNASRPPDLPGNITSQIPTVSITRTNGVTLRAAMATATVTVTLVRSSTLDRDGTIDNAIVAHEWGHYISNRLVGDGNGLSNAQADGMGEGWADFHSMLMVVKAEDAQVAANANYSGTYALAAYTSFATDPQGYYWGIRRMPYSTDMTKNPLTFKHIQEGVALPNGPPMAFGRSGQGNSESHATGEVWATMLWECYAALLRDTTRLTFAQAQDRMLRYLVAAYKATALQPTFVDARDAILAVAVANDRQDFTAFWQAFAKRGLGMGAIAPDRDSVNNLPVTESFFVGNAVQIVSVTLDDSTTNCDHDGILDNAEQGLLKVTVKNVGVGDLTQTTVTALNTLQGLTFPSGDSANFGPLVPFATATASIPVALASQSGIQATTLQISVFDPTLASGAAVTLNRAFRVNASVVPTGSDLDDVEAPMSVWQVANDPNGNTGSDWRIFQAGATDHYWFGPNPSSPADIWLISPQFDVSTTDPFIITFKHRFDFEADANTNYDGAVIELSGDNGQTWRDIGVNATPGYTGTLSGMGSNPLRGKRAFAGRSTGYPAFQTVTVNQGMANAGQLVKIRFRIGSDDAAAGKGWEIDDISFRGVNNAPFPSVITDPNSCTNAPPTFTVGADQVVTEGDMVTLTATGMDPDNDPVTFTFAQKSGPMAVNFIGGTFTAPAVTADTDLVFNVTASDGKAMVGPQTIKVTVKNQPHAPVVSATAFVEVDEGNVATLTSTATDADGDAVTLRWSQLSGPAVTLQNSTSATASFEAPQVAADTSLTLQVVANDGVLDSAPVKVEVLVHDKTIRLGAAEVTGALPTGCGCQTGVDGVALAWGLVMLRLRRRR